MGKTKKSPTPTIPVQIEQPGEGASSRYSGTEQALVIGRQLGGYYVDPRTKLPLLWRPSRLILPLDTAAVRIQKTEAKVVTSSAAIGGDLYNTPAIPRVGGLRGVPINITAPTDGQVYQYNAAARQWKPVTLSSGAAAGALALFPHVQGGAAASWANTTFNLLVPSTEIITTGSKFRLVWKSTTNTFVVGAAVVRRTTPGSTTFIDSTAITWGGINPTFTGSPITQVSDECSVTIDRSHDYYFQVYVTAGSSASAQLITQDLSGAFAGLTGGTKAGNNTAGAYSGYANGATLFGIQHIQVTG